MKNLGQQRFKRVFECDGSAILLTLEECPTYETESLTYLRKAEDQMDDGRRVKL